MYGADVGPEGCMYTPGVGPVPDVCNAGVPYVGPEGFIYAAGLPPGYCIPYGAGVGDGEEILTGALLGEVGDADEVVASRGLEGKVDVKAPNFRLFRPKSDSISRLI